MTLRHDTIVSEWESLCLPAFSKPCVTAEPLINRATRTVETAATQASAPSESAPVVAESGGESSPADLRGDLGVAGFWSKGKKTVFDVTISDLDAASYGGCAAMKVVGEREKAKRSKYEPFCRESRLDFTPPAFGVDGSVGGSANAAIRRLASALAARGNRQYSELCGFVRSRLSIALVRAAHVCLRGARDSHAKPARPYFESSAGYSLYR